MPSMMISNAYGKFNVRVVKVTAGADASQAPTMNDVSVNVELTGDFARAFLNDDERPILSTKAMKDIVYGVAGRATSLTSRAGGALEDFTHAVAAEFLESNPTVVTAHVTAAQDVLVPACTSKATFKACFVRSHGGERRVADVVASRAGTTTCTSRIHNVPIFRTSGPDQILATALDVKYTFFSNSAGSVDYEATYHKVRDACVEAFATNTSKTRHPTLLSVGRAVITAADDVRDVLVRMPNYYLSPVAPPGEGGSVVYAPSAGPTGMVQCQVKRHHVQIPVPFRWSPDFDIKDDLLNQQHSDLFDLIRTLDGDRTNTAVLQQIMSHAKKHFDDEERIFEAAGFPTLKASAHARMHKRFLHQATKATSGKKVDDATILFLKKWLVDHIMGADMQYANFVEKKEKAKSKL